MFMVIYVNYTDSACCPKQHVVLFLSQSVWFKKITNMYNHHSGCHGNGEMFLYEWKEKAPYCVCIDLDCIFVSSKRMKRKVCDGA